MLFDREGNRRSSAGMAVLKIREISTYVERALNGDYIFVVFSLARKFSLFAFL